MSTVLGQIVELEVLGETSRTETGHYVRASRIELSSRAPRVRLTLYKNSEPMRTFDVAPDLFELMVPMLREAVGGEL